MFKLETGFSARTTSFVGVETSSDLYRVIKVDATEFKLKNRAQDGDLAISGGAAGYVFEKVDAQIVVEVAESDDKIKSVDHGFIVGVLVTYTTNGATAKHAGAAIVDGKTHKITHTDGPSILDFTLEGVTFPIIFPKVILVWVYRATLSSRRPAHF